MIYERLRTDTSMILSPHDLEGTSLHRSNSMMRSSTFNFFKSDSNSPSSSQCGKSEKDITLEEDLIKLSEDLTLEKERN